MFHSVTNGFDLLKSSTRALIRYPRLWVPLLVCWLVYVGIVIFWKWGYQWDHGTLKQNFLVVFGGIAALAVFFSWSSLVQLELVKQVESNRPMSLLRALPVGTGNLIIAWPIVLLWALIWFVLSLVEAILRRFRNRDDDDDEISMRSVAKTVTRFEKFSLTGAFFQALRKGVRMLAFIIYPAIAWEGHGPFKSIKRGLGIARVHWKHFAAAFVMTEAVAFIVLLPLAILFFVSDRMDAELPDFVWFSALLYGGISWSYVMFLEQMFTAELYLWHLMWESEARKAEEKGENPPKSLRHIRRPTILDNIPEFLFDRPATKKKWRRSRSRRN